VGSVLVLAGGGGGQRRPWAVREGGRAWQAASSGQPEEGDNMQPLFIFIFKKSLNGLTCGALSRSTKKIIFATLLLADGSHL
jgi:hypothetical protein